jgi:glycosyltransferase involved in cell wall biosynthesis
MPTHNPGAFIIEALQSCVAQSYKDVVITVVDDCSTTDLSYIKKKFPKVNFIKTPKNLGPGGARNFGILNTNGELISFLDDDDVMDHNKILWSVEEFKKNPKIGMTCGNYRILVHGVLRPPFYRKAPIINWNTLMKINYVASGSATVSRKVLEDVGLFDERFWIGEDYSLWLKISEKFKISYINKILYYYRIIPGGNSLTQRSDIKKDLLKNIEIIQKESRERMEGK